MSIHKQIPACIPEIYVDDTPNFQYVILLFLVLLLIIAKVMYILMSTH